jgi:hypothetical protein
VRRVEGSLARLLAAEAPDVEGVRQALGLELAELLVDLGGVEDGDDLALRHALAGGDRQAVEDAALQVLDGLALALGEEDAVGGDRGVEAGVEAPAEGRRDEGGDHEERGEEGGADALVGVEVFGGGRHGCTAQRSAGMVGNAAACVGRTPGDRFVSASRAQSPHALS